MGPDVRTLEAVKGHDVVLRAKVVEVARSPGFWSGTFAAVQEVRYDVLEVYKGPAALAGGQAKVGHVLVGHGPAEDTKPGLNPALVRPGAEVVLFAKESFPGLEKGLYVCGDDPMGIGFR